MGGGYSTEANLGGGGGVFWGAPMGEWAMMENVHCQPRGRVSVREDSDQREGGVSDQKEQVYSSSVKWKFHESKEVKCQELKCQELKCQELKRQELKCQRN